MAPLRGEPRSIWLASSVEQPHTSLDARVCPGVPDWLGEPRGEPSVWTASPRHATLGPFGGKGPCSERRPVPRRVRQVNTDEPPLVQLHDVNLVGQGRELSQLLSRSPRARARLTCLRRSRLSVRAAGELASGECDTPIHHRCTFAVESPADREHRVAFITASSRRPELVALSTPARRSRKAS